LNEQAKELHKAVFPHCFFFLLLIWSNGVFLYASLRLHVTGPPTGSMTHYQWHKEKSLEERTL